MSQMSSVHAASKGTFSKILVAVDGSNNSRRAFDVASTLAKGQNAELVLVNVIPLPIMSGEAYPSLNLADYLDVTKKDAKNILDNLAEQARANNINVSTEIVEGMTSTVYAITRYAEEHNVDLIVVGTRGLGGFKKLVLGSVSSGVLNHATCSVFVAR